MPAHQLYDERLPGRIYTHSIRQLLSERYGGREADQPGPLGHGRTGGLRQAAAAVLPADRRVPHMLLARQPRLLRERARQVVPGGAAPLPVDAHHPGRHEARPPRGQGHHREAQGQETRAHHLPAGSKHGEGDQRGEVPGMQRADAEGAEDGVRRGHPRRAVPRAARAQEPQVQPALNAAVRGPRCQLACNQHGFLT